MGFFSSLIKGVGSVIGAIVNPVGTITGLLGGGTTTPAAPTPAAAAAATAVNPVRPAGIAGLAAQPAFAIGGAAVGAAAVTARLPVQQIVQRVAPAVGVLGAIGGPIQRGIDVPALIANPPAAALAQAGIMSRGNGQFVKRTIVQTINLATGAVVNQVVLDGAPFLMNKEVASLARVTRKLGKANRKIPRRTIKQSLASRLSEKALTEAIDNVGSNGCPK